MSEQGNHFALLIISCKGDIMIRLNQISKHYVDGNKVITAIDKISLSLELNEFVVVVGASGSGKSTSVLVVAVIATMLSCFVFLNKTPAQLSKTRTK